MERGFENYVSDLSSITAENDSISQRFFSRLAEPGELTPLQFEAEIKADRGAMDTLVNRAEDLDTPDELSDAQELVELSYELRSDGLSGVAESIAPAIGDPEAKETIDEIVGDIRVLASGDVISARAQAQIEEELARQDISAGGDRGISTQFVPDEPNWLAAGELARALEEFASEDQSEKSAPAAP